MCFPRGKQDHSQSELNLLLKRQSQSQPVTSICFSLLASNLMRIPEWNAGKRWYSGPSTSGRGGHGNGRGQALRVVRNGQGREISPYRCRPFIILHRCAPAHLRDPHDLEGLQTGQPRFCTNYGSEWNNGVYTEGQAKGKVTYAGHVARRHAQGQRARAN